MTKKATQKDTSKMTRPEKAEVLRAYAAEGYSSADPAVWEALGWKRAYEVRFLAREYGIDIPADEGQVRTHRVDPTKECARIAGVLEGLASRVELVDTANLDVEALGECSESMAASLKVLSAFGRRVSKVTS